ncbi:dTDP-4-dehydrorhamnose reductase [Burkholderia sp. Ac-20384]|uniref:dTDP-4-dehydrorhamnose reductase n=1 Tax=Burkholderia sp. Ac-20384 TaxID=2703902 RepID=UPI001982341F|nr:dTDP-4-dehydrorhamnose reductase [Burkholderia sp. Ac-20384]MBN3824742.1 dTDP-4-dehydrorhamnose reductase [Burkholderia sp. Ac-20384]
MNTATGDHPRILVTGANGQLGFELARTLAPHGHVIAADRTVVDLADLDRLRGAICDLRPDLIINAAAYTAVDGAESEPDLAMRVNGEAPGIIADEAVRAGAMVIHYSTDYVFDGRKDEPYIETDSTGPLNVYGRTKLAGEQAIARAGGKHLVFRTSWVYGTRGKNFLLTMRALAEKHDTLRVVADQIGAPTWSETLADLTSHVVAQLFAQRRDDARWWAAHSGVYHMTAAGDTSWAGFADTIFAESRLARRPLVVPIPSDEYPTPAARPCNSRLSNAKLERAFGVRVPHWHDALKQCCRRLDTENSLVRA